VLVRSPCAEFDRARGLTNGVKALVKPLSNNAAFWFVAAAISVVVLGANTPIPLFTVYQSQWHFSTGVLTIVYAVYSVGVVAAVFGIGPLSDAAGRKRVLIPALVTMAAGLCACMLAPNVTVLIVGRILQGVAIGAGTTTAVAALGELHPAGKAHAQVALVATVAIVVGLAGGPLIAGLLAEFGPWPTVLPYLVSLALLAAVLAGVVRMPETVAVSGPLRLQPRRIVIPADIRRPFLLATYVEMTAYAVAGTFAGLGASFTRDLLHIESHAAAGLLVALLFLASTAAQLLWRSLSLKRSMVTGLALLAAGLPALLGALASGSALVFFTATVILGFGHGLAYVGSQELTDRIAPPARRAEVFSGFQLGLYLGATLPSLLVGFGAAAIGFYGATVAFVCAVFGLTVAGMAWLALTREKAVAA
jgi:MFS family permease